MKDKSINHMGIRIKITLITIGLAALFWTVEALVEVYVFHHGGSLLYYLFPPYIHIIWYRLIVIILLAMLGAISIYSVTEHKRLKEAIRVSNLKTRFLFENMPDGYAYCKILLDDKNQSSDFLYLEVNDSFERLTGLKKENVIGKKATEILPTMKKTHPALFDIYGQVALTGKEANFDVYLNFLNKWFSIFTFSPQKGYFITVFNDSIKHTRGQGINCEEKNADFKISGII